MTKRSPFVSITTVMTSFFVSGIVQAQESAEQLDLNSARRVCRRALLWEEIHVALLLHPRGRATGMECCKGARSNDVACPV